MAHKQQQKPGSTGRVSVTASSISGRPTNAVGKWQRREEASTFVLSRYRCNQHNVSPCQLLSYTACNRMNDTVAPPTPPPPHHLSPAPPAAFQLLWMLTGLCQAVEARAPSAQVLLVGSAVGGVPEADPRRHRLRQADGIVQGRRCRAAAAPRGIRVCTHQGSEVTAVRRCAEQTDFPAQSGGGSSLACSCNHLHQAQR